MTNGRQGPRAARATERREACVRRFIVAFAAAIAGVEVGSAQEQVFLPGTSIPQFQDPLPRPAVVTGTELTIRMCEIRANVLPTGTFVPGERPATWVWAYVAGEACPDPSEPLDTYVGPVIVATRGVPTQVTWVNELGATGGSHVLAWTRSTDQTLHWASPRGLDCTELEGPPAPGDACFENYDGPIPAVPHLHGGEVPPVLDGGPEQWFTSTGLHGPAYYGGPGGAPNAAVFRYPNGQEAAPLWVHDHALGVTRLNVYAGLAGGYLLVDPANPPPGNLPAPTPLVIQDRLFDVDGELVYTAGDAGGVLWALNPEHPYWNPEFVGDTIVVNGTAWPYVELEPRRHRFLVLNGSQARAYELSFVDQATGAEGPPLWVIGTDGGYLDRPAKLDAAAGEKLVVLPGERYDVVVDLAGLAPGTRLLLRNVARTPYPFGETPRGNTTGRVLQARVVACESGACGAADGSFDPASGAALRTTPLPALGPPALVRQLTLNEVEADEPGVIDPRTGSAYPGGPLEVLVNNTTWTGETPAPRADFTAVSVDGATAFYSELPLEGTTELWEIVNLTADAHPMHLHLAQFRIRDRQAFDARRYGAAYDAAFPAIPGDPACTGGVYCPGAGPPLHYATGNPRALGGNPDVEPYLRGPARRPPPHEAGWKDTVVVPPGTVTRLLVRWAPQDATPDALHYAFDPSGGWSSETGAISNGYVWHCHILDHEDHEMMRPMVLRPAPGAGRTLLQGVDY